MTRDFTFERPAGKLKLARGAEVEMAWRDGEASPAAAAPRAPVPRRRPAGALRGQPAAGRLQEVVRAGAGERVSAAGDRPGDKLKTFTIENKEGFLLAGRTKPLSTREISLGGASNLLINTNRCVFTFAPCPRGALVL
jgi:hypothetical protein